MAEAGEFRFTIDRYTPETLPMARLAEYLSQLATLFGEKQAVHLTTSEAEGAGATGPWAKVKYDRQIVAIAKVSGATAIYSDDDVRTLGGRHGIPVLGLADLPLPAGAAQGLLDLGDPPPP